jgi:hypothetical protein
MSGQSAGQTTESVKREIKSIEHNQHYDDGPGPAINNLPCHREGEDGFKKKKSHGG